jgi:lysophospholipase L1-like esterase
MVRNTNEALDKQHIYGDLNVRKVLMEISASQKVPLIDLMGLSSGWALQQGQSLTQDYFVNNDRTHSNELGADVFAKFIVQEIRKQNIAIHSFLR